MAKTIAVNLYSGVCCTLHANPGVHAPYNIIDPPQVPPDCGGGNNRKENMTIHRQQWHDHVRYLIFEDNGSIQVEHYEEPLGEEQCQAYAYALWVVPVSRGKGIAKRLMEQAEKITKEAGITHLHIRTWPNEAEEWTRQWYKRLGFRPIGVHKNDMSVEWRKELKISERS